MRGMRNRNKLGIFGKIRLSAKLANLLLRLSFPLIHNLSLQPTLPPPNCISSSEIPSPISSLDSFHNVQERSAAVQPFRGCRCCGRQIRFGEIIPLLTRAKRLRA